MLPQRVKVFEALCALYAKRLSYVHVRLIARRAHVPMSTASSELACLEAVGIVVRKGSRGGWKPRHMYERTYRHLLDIYRRSHDFVTAYTIADLQGRSHWMVRKHLKKLKAAGLVVQGSSRGGGWKPKRQADIVPASGLVLDVLSQLYVEDFSFVRTVEIAQRLDVSATHVRNVLRDYEGVGRVERKGSRGGWKPIEKVLSAEL